MGPKATRPRDDSLRRDDELKIAVPMEGGLVCPHFGHAPEFLVVATDEDKPVAREVYENPGHEPGRLPRWLADLGVKTILAGGMGDRAVSLFKANGIRVCLGVSGPAEEVVDAFLSGRLEEGESLCDHQPGSVCGHGDGGCHH